MAKATYVQIGDSMDYTNTGTKIIEYNEIVPLKDRKSVV